LPAQIQLGATHAEHLAVLARQPPHQRLSDQAGVSGDPDALAGERIDQVVRHPVALPRR